MASEEDAAAGESTTAEKSEGDGKVADEAGKNETVADEDAQLPDGDDRSADQGCEHQGGAGSAMDVDVGVDVDQQAEEEEEEEGTEAPPKADPEAAACDRATGQSPQAEEGASETGEAAACAGASCHPAAPDPPEAQGSGEAAAATSNGLVDVALRLLVQGVPEGVTGPELADFLSGAVWGASGHAAEVQPSMEMPCSMCSFNSPPSGGPSEVLAVFRTACGANVAMSLHGLECRGSQLRLLRPRDYVAPEFGDPSLTLRLSEISLADLTGAVGEEESPPAGPGLGQAPKSGPAVHPETGADAPLSREEGEAGPADPAERVEPAEPSEPAEPAEPATESAAGTDSAKQGTGEEKAEEQAASVFGNEKEGGRERDTEGEQEREKKRRKEEKARQKEKEKEKEKEREGEKAAAGNHGDTQSPNGEAKPPPEEARESKEKEPMDHYEVLGVTMKATASEIKKAYHSKCRLLHPDKNHSDPNATSRFQRVSEAYQVLSTPTRRAQYDATLVMQKACGSLGVQHDPRATTFAQRHCGIPGREVQAMQIEARHVAHLMGRNSFQLQQLKQQSGADILVLQSQLSAQAQLLLAGPPAAIERARALITACIAELTGSQAPRDGVVVVVPQHALARMPRVAASFQAIFLQTGSAARFATADRIVVQGGPRVPQAVAQVQWALDWQGHILLPNGQLVNAWEYAHQCEAANHAATNMARTTEAFQFLLPPADPDANAVRRLLCMALSTTEDKERSTPLVTLAAKALKAFQTTGHLTGAVVRAATSAAVHQEYQALTPQAGAAMLCALHAVLPVAGAAISQPFANLPLFKSLTTLSAALNDPREGLALRARGFTAVLEAVPEDGEWHKWEALLVPGGPLSAFWEDLRTWISDRRQTLGIPAPPADWLGVPNIMASLLRVCVGPPVECDLANGIRRKAQQVPQKQSAEGETAPPPKARPEPAGAPSAKSETPGPAAEEGRWEGEGDDQLTLLEKVEEILLELAGADPSSLVYIGMLTQEAQKRVTNIGDERLSKKWYELHRGSFELKRLGEGSKAEWRVRLLAPAHARAGARVQERQAEAQRKRELKVAEEVLPKLSAESVPRTLRPPELAALLCVLSRGRRPGAEELPAALLKRLCRRGDATPRELLVDCWPFSPAQLLRALVALERQRREPESRKADRDRDRWDRDALDLLLQAAALDFHAVEARPRAPLPAAATALWAAARRPFDERLSGSRCLLVPSAALRLQLELAEQTALAEGSAFRPFAQLCAWLAHIVVTSNLPPEVRNEALQAFKKLAGACEEMAKSIDSAPCDPEGLCRLAMAVALVARSERGALGTNALESLAQVCVQRAMDEAIDWQPQQLAVMASAYAAAEVCHEGLFQKICTAAERHTLLGNEWSTEQLLKLLHSAWQLGQLGTLGKLLHSIQADTGLRRCLKEGTSRDVPLLFSILVLLEDDTLLEELAKNHREKLQGVSLHGLVSMLKEWPGGQETGMGASSLPSFKSAVLREAMALASRKAPLRQELEALVEAASQDSKAAPHLVKLAASPGTLASLPEADTSLPDAVTGIGQLLETFANAGVESARLEAACVAKLLPVLEKTPAETLDALAVARAALLFHETAFRAMPAVVEAFASKLFGAKTSRLPTAEAAEVRKLCERLVHAVARASCEPAHSSGDAELDGWVERLERLALDEGRAGSERRLDWLEQNAARKFSAAKEALGSNWLSMLLVRSHRLSWTGSKMVLLRPPRPQTALKRLADTASLTFGPALRAEVDALEPEVPESSGQPLPPGALGVAQPEPAGRGASGAEEAQSHSQKQPSPSPGAGEVKGVGFRGGVAPKESQRAQPKKPGLVQPRLPGSLVVSGGWDQGIADTIAGTYMASSSNHNHAVYRRVDPPSESRVLLYFWDDRDGEEQCGWWFGPEVGGEEVWAHNAEEGEKNLPPERGWRVLHSGTVDEALTVVSGSDAPPAVSAGPVSSTGGVRPRSSASFGQTLPARGGGAPARPSAAPGSGPGPSGKRPRPGPGLGVESERALELRRWLESLDDGAGALLQYFDVLAAEFDADLAQIAAARVEGGEKLGILGAVDPSFWETVRVEKTGHKMLLARGIAKLE